MTDEDLSNAANRADQVARRLRGEMERGRYQPGDKLPTEPLLARHYRVSRETVRKALAMLRTEGLVDVVHGTGTFVRRPPLQLPMSRYSRAARVPGKGPFEASAHAAGLDGYTEMVMVSERDADDYLASRLEIEPGDRYVYRRRYMHIMDEDRDRIVQIQEAHLPLAVVGGTPVAAEDKLEDGIYAALDAIGRSPASFTEHVRARMLTREESMTMLPRASGVPVQEVHRTTRDAGGVVLEWLVVVALADQTILVYDDVPLI